MSVLPIVGFEDISGCRKLDLNNVASLGSYPALPSHCSPCITQNKNIDSSFTPPCPVTDIVPFMHTFSHEGPKHQNVFELMTAFNNCEDNWADFSEMRLPRWLSPLAPESGETTDASIQDPLRPLEFSSCLSTSHVNRQPALRYKSSPIQPQALPGKTNPQSPLCTSLHVNELRCSVVEKNSWPIRSNRDHNGEISECKSVEQKKNMPDSENDQLKGKEDNILERQMNESVVRGFPKPRYNAEADNEPYRKKAKMSGYSNGADTQISKVVNPCSVKIKNISHSDNIQYPSNTLTSEKMDCLKAVKKKKTVSIDLKSQEKLALSQVSQNFKSKGQEACQNDFGDTKQPATRSFLQKRTCEVLMEDFSEISKLNNLSAVLNTLSSSSYHDLPLTQMSTKCVPNHGTERPPKAKELNLNLAEPVTKVENLADKCEANTVPGPEMDNSFTETEDVILDENLNREKRKQPKRDASLNKKTSFCDKIFHQSIFSVGTADTQELSVNLQSRSVFQATDRNPRTSLPPRLTSKKLTGPPEPDQMNTMLLMDDSKKEMTDIHEESEMERSVPGTNKYDYVLDNARGKKIDSKNRVDRKQVKRSCKSVKGCLVKGNFVSDFGMDNKLQRESTTLLHSFRPENTMEKPTDKRIPESFCEAPVSNKFDRIEGTQIVYLGEHEIWSKEKEKEKTECVEISRMNEYEFEICDLVMDEYTQLATDQRDEVVATGGNINDTDFMGRQMSLEVDNDGADAHAKEFNGLQVLRTEVEAMPADEGNIEFFICRVEHKDLSHFK